MKPAILIISQVYVPDPAAVGQHIAGAASELVRRGYRVVVYTSRNGYEDARTVYSAREQIDGVDVRRLPLSSFGKGSIRQRLVAQIVFLLQAMMRGTFIPSLAGVVVSTSPPACGIGGAIVSLLRRVPLKFWVMDLNPDQLVKLKVLPPRSWPVRLFDLFNLITLWRASDVVVLDRFMAERVARKAKVAHKLHILPPWPLQDQADHLPHHRNPFRQQHVAEGRLVVMYSGNHTPANPLTTLLQAALRLQDDPRLQVMCIGGGAAKHEVDALVESGAANITSLPYQPLAAIHQSLSAADVHVVSIGDDMVGIVHPCKVYGAMAVGRPVLMLGPAACHIGELIERHRIGWRVAHGDVDGAERALRAILSTSPDELLAMGHRAAEALAHGLSKRQLSARLCDVLQRELVAPQTDADVFAGL